MTKIWAIFLILFATTAYANEPCDSDELADSTNSMMRLAKESIATAQRIRTDLKEEDVREALKQIRERRVLVSKINANFLACTLSVIEVGNSMIQKDKEFEAFLLKIFPSAGDSK